MHSFSTFFQKFVFPRGGSKILESAHKRVDLKVGKLYYINSFLKKNLWAQLYLILKFCTHELFHPTSLPTLQVSQTQVSHIHTGFVWTLPSAAWISLWLSATMVCLVIPLSCDPHLWTRIFVSGGILTSLHFKAKKKLKKKRKNAWHFWSISNFFCPSPQNWRHLTSSFWQKGKTLSVEKRHFSNDPLPNMLLFCVFVRRNADLVLLVHLNGTNKCFGGREGDTLSISYSSNCIGTTWEMDIRKGRQT